MFQATPPLPIISDSLPSPYPFSLPPLPPSFLTPPLPSPLSQMVSLAEDLIKGLDSNHDQSLSEEEFITYYSKKMGHMYTKNKVLH